MHWFSNFFGQYLPIRRRRKWQPTPVFLLGKSHGWRSLVGHSPQGHKELDMTEWFHFTSIQSHINWHILYVSHMVGSSRMNHTWKTPLELGIRTPHFKHEVLFFHWRQAVRMTSAPFGFWSGRPFNTLLSTQHPTLRASLTTKGSLIQQLD